MSETYTATVDRIVDGQTAVLLLEDDGETVDQIDLDVSKLPSAGRHEGAVLAVELVGGEFDGAEYLPDVTRTRTESAQERLDRLSTRASDRE